MPVATVAQHLVALSRLPVTMTIHCSGHRRLPEETRGQATTSRSAAAAARAGTEHQCRRHANGS